MRDLRDIELRRLHAKNERTERRLAMMRLPGRVVAKDPEKRMLRLQLGTTADGSPILSPWVRWQEPGAGGLKVHSEPAIGEQMALVSQSGSVGTASIAVPGTYDRHNNAPSTSSDSAVFERAEGRIELGPKGIVLIGNVLIENGRVTHDGVNIGKDHIHTDDDIDGLTGLPLGD